MLRTYLGLLARSLLSPVCLLLETSEKLKFVPLVNVKTLSIISLGKWRACTQNLEKALFVISVGGLVKVIVVNGRVRVSWIFLVLVGLSPFTIGSLGRAAESKALTMMRKLWKYPPKIKCWCRPFVGTKGRVSLSIPRAGGIQFVKVGLKAVRFRVPSTTGFESLFVNSSKPCDCARKARGISVLLLP
jgi:hypothetical protein